MTLEISGNQICQEKFKQFIFDCNNNPICISNINYCIPMTQTKLAKQKEKIVPSIFDNHKQLIKK